MDDTKRTLIHIFGFAAFIASLSIFLWLGPKETIQYWAINVVSFAYPASVVGTFLIRMYISSVKLTEMKVDSGGKRFDMPSVLLISNTTSAMFVELATLTWIFVSFFAVGWGAETDTYRHIHPFEQFSTYAVIPYLSVVVHFSLKSLKKGPEMTPIGIRIQRS